MSVVIYYCWAVKAVDGNREAFDNLCFARDKNMNRSYTTMGCDCQPKCRKLTKEEYDELNRRLEEAIPYRPIPVRH